MKIRINVTNQNKKTSQSVQPIKSKLPWSTPLAFHTGTYRTARQKLWIPKSMHQQEWKRKSQKDRSRDENMWQCRGSGSGRIGIILPDPDRHSQPTDPNIKICIVFANFEFQSGLIPS